MIYVIEYAVKMVLVGIMILGLAFLFEKYIANHIIK